ncbi:rho GTPase-activating protein 20-like [Acipenser ruthenus]|uniref:rho GTPase-activating protein 20-like n=1 Tax=Acipenser ruthenus TaxID=7906 RepID=UPI002740FC44|nr:rho GTPase-activating protein 20-like [Acipenser ruthenus]
MTPQQNNCSHLKGDSDAVRSRIQEREKKMKTTMQRRRSAPSAISKALSRSRTQSRDGPLSPGSTINGSLIQAFSAQNSAFIMEERVQLTTGLQTQERHLFLYSDTLIIAKSKSSSSLKLKEQVRVCELWIASCIDVVSERKMNPETSFVIGWPTTNYVVTLSSSEAKGKWLSALQWQINEMKQEEYQKEIALKIMLLDVGNHTSSTMTLNVGSTDTAEKVIKLSTQQLGSPGQPSDYHLWVMSGKEETPYPLIGHELPFSIIMNCLRDSADQPSRANNNILAPDGALLLEQLPWERQCQFILKPRPVARSHVRTDSFQKHIKRKKSLIDWALRRGSSSPSGSQLGSPTSPRKLFGHSLPSICPSGKLPKPIMDMLCLLYHEGPSTMGIFRRSANAKTCKELKERLNSGDAVQVEGESVFVAAAVITDFLRNIPGSILSAALYHKWMEAMERNNSEEKLEAIKRLVERLPEANVTLLRYLFALLHHIERRSEENQMTAFNLALCIAPNMLWLPVSTGPEEESRSTRKVAMLVQLLIEKAPAIFGEDIVSLFNKHHKDQLSSSEDALDGHFQQQYSSDEFDSTFSEQEKPKTLNRKERDSFFLPLNDSVLKEEKEDWGLLDEMDAYKKKVLNEDSAYSCDNLDEVSFRSSGSVCSLATLQSIRSTRDRCSSEPSVCMSSQLLSRLHEPVARQSSCDAAMIRGQTDCSQYMQKLRLDSPTVLEGDASPRVNNRTKPGLWRSPQIASRIRHLGPHRMNLSNRSSFSSLSSTTTSPSASSLSSLDSAFSYCSDSLFSPAEVSSLPLMFGTSTRLQPLSPEFPSKFSKDWSMTLPASMAREPCDLDWYEEYDEKDEENNNCINEIEDTAVSRVPEEVQEAYCESTLSVNSYRSAEDDGGDSEHEGRETEPSQADVGKNQESMELEPEFGACDSESKPQRIETSVKHIEMVRPKTGKDKMKRTKITFYMAPGKVKMNNHSEQSEKEKPTISVNVSGSGDDPPVSAEHQSQTVKVYIPQTVFYRQNTPLVLQSVSTRQNSEVPDVQVQTEMNGPAEAAAASIEHLPTSKTHSKAASTIRHTIRIILPASVRNTVKEYFLHGDAKNCHTDAKAVEKELVRSKLEWQNRKHTSTPKETLGKMGFGEESFI